MTKQLNNNTISTANDSIRTQAGVSWEIAIKRKICIFCILK